MLAAGLPVLAQTVTFDVVHGTNGFAANSTNYLTPNLDLSHASGFAMSVQIAPYSPNTNTAGTGTIYLLASNSVDNVTWFADPARNWSVAYSNTATVRAITNFTGLGHVPYEKYGIGNSGTNASIIFIGKAFSKINL